MVLGDLDSGMINLEAHRLALAIVKKTLDENYFKTAQKTMDRQPPFFKNGDKVYFKNKQPGKWSLKWRPAYRIVQIEHDGHFLHIENQARNKVQSCHMKDVVLEPPVEFWNIDTQFVRAGKYVNHPANLPTISLHDYDNHPLNIDHCKKFSTHFTYIILYMISLINTYPLEKMENQYSSNQFLRHIQHVILGSSKDTSP